MPSRPPEPLSRHEIAEIALDVAAQRGYYHARVEELEREDDGWEVEVKGWVRGRRAELELMLDGWDGHVRKIEEERDDD